MISRIFLQKLQVFHFLPPDTYFQFPKFSTDGQTLLFIKTFGGTSSIGIIRLDYSKSFLFPLNGKRIQSIDW